MKFKDLKVGDKVYCAFIKNSELVNNEIKVKQVSERLEYKATASVEIHFSDDTMIIPGKDEEYVVRGLGTLVNPAELFNFTIYACSHKDCLDILTRLISSKIIQVEEAGKKIDFQLKQLCKTYHYIEEITRKSSVVAETVYAD